VVDHAPCIHRGNRKVVLDDSSVFHYEFDVLQHCDVDSGVALNRNQVGELSDLDGADVIGPTNQLCGRRCGGAQCLQR